MVTPPRPLFVEAPEVDMLGTRRAGSEHGCSEKLEAIRHCRGSRWGSRQAPSKRRGVAVDPEGPMVAWLTGADADREGWRRRHRCDGADVFHGRPHRGAVDRDVGRRPRGSAGPLSTGGASARADRRARGSRRGRACRRRRRDGDQIAEQPSCTEQPDGSGGMVLVPASAMERPDARLSKPRSLVGEGISGAWRVRRPEPRKRSWLRVGVCLA
jgi:hypothetical protein